MAQGPRMAQGIGQAANPPMLPGNLPHFPPHRQNRPQAQAPPVIRQDGGPNQGMNVHINNNNGPDPREVPADEAMLHWYVPLQSPATRREVPQSALPYYLASAAMMGCRAALLPTVELALKACKRAGILGQLQETCRGVLHTVTGYSSDSLTIMESLAMLTGFKKAATATGIAWFYQKLHQVSKPNSLVTTLFSIRRHGALIKAVLLTGAGFALGFAFWRTTQRWFYNSQPYEPEGIGHPTIMAEVTQEEAQASPTHFACPALLRAHILEKVFMQERTPNLVQRVKSIAGKWCDEKGINPYERPAYIAGAVAVAMTTSQLEIDLLSYEKRWEVRRAARLLTQHHNGVAGEPPRNQRGFWNWLTGPGRR